MRLVEDLVQKTLDNMSADERRSLVLSVVQHMLAQMSAPERAQLMEHVVDSFLAGLTEAERQSTVRDLVPRLLAQMMAAGKMNVDELLWAAMGSLGALSAKEGTDQSESGMTDATEGKAPGDGGALRPEGGDRHGVSE